MKTYYIREVVTGTARNGNKFSAFSLIDTSGAEMRAYLYADNDFSAFMGHVIVGSFDPSQPYPKLTQDDLSTAYPVEKHPTPEFDRFKVSVPNPDDVLDLVCHILGYCKQADGTSVPQNVKDAILADLEATLASYAQAYGAHAKHHNYKGGLLQHVYEMLVVLDMFAANPYISPVPFNTFRALLGILYHDYGKLLDYSSDGQYTEDLCLTPHTYSSARYFVKTFSQFLQPKDLQMIEHIILSHHGRVEWGAAIVPATGTALLVHMLDMLSARGNAMKRAANMTRVADFTYVME